LETKALVIYLDIADAQSNRIAQANKGVTKAIKNPFHGITMMLLRLE